MFKKVLIANRGEIALRIIRACKELDVKTVAVYSEADVDSMHVHLADEAICIGPGPSSESYLKMSRIISAAEIANVDAIHPGYGFLSEKEEFAEVCEKCKIKFIGPSSRVIAMMGDKNVARETAKKAGIPITPGSDGIIQSEEEAIEWARKIGYPVMIKASAGGGGRGMRPVLNEATLISSFQAASLEAMKCFGDGSMYMEKLVEKLTTSSSRSSPTLMATSSTSVSATAPCSAAIRRSLRSARLPKCLPSSANAWATPQ
jgi:acetyl-CoA carboxylase biotin carboxylase subunit